MELRVYYCEQANRSMVYYCFHPLVLLYCPAWMYQPGYFSFYSNP